MIGFTFVRNPWERVYSSYCYEKAVGHLPVGFTFTQFVRALDTFVARPSSLPLRLRRIFDFHGVYWEARRYIMDEKERIIVDYVGRFETRSEDLKTISAKLGFELEGRAHVQGATENLHYSTQYTYETRNTVSRLYRGDIETFDYAYDIETKERTGLNRFSPTRTTVKERFPLFSVVVPTYDRPQRLRCCLQALARLARIFHQQKKRSPVIRYNSGS